MLSHSFNGFRIIQFYSASRCIALCVLQNSKEFGVFLFRQSSWIRPLRKHMFTCTSSKGPRLWFVIGGFRSICLFRVSRALLCDRPVSGNNRLVKFASQIFWSFLFLSRLPPSFDKNSTHHRDLPWFFVSLFVGSLESFSANASWASKLHFDLH